MRCFLDYSLIRTNTAEGKERRDRLVSQICSNVRIVLAKQEDQDVDVMMS